MRDLIITQNITVDGVIDASEGWFDPTDADFDGADIAQALQEQWQSADAVLMGRKTFEAMRGFWPQQTDDDTGVSEFLNRVRKYVVSRTLGDPGWDNSVVMRGELVEELQALKDGAGADIVATGSLTLMPPLVASGLVDEYRLFIYPVVLGRGQRLFQDATGVGKLELVESRSFKSGVALQRYRAAGER